MESQIFTYRSIAAPSEGFFRDRGSKFIGYAYPIDDREQAIAHLEEVRSLHSKARHHCFSWRLGAQGQDYRIADDGEPAGSAGQPIYNQLLSLDLTNVIVIVVRYFGGTKLGIPGLINAYKTATYEALIQSEVKVHTLTARYEVATNYDHAARLMSAFKEKNIDVVDVSYLDRVTFQLKVPLKQHESRINDALVSGFQLHAPEMLDALESDEMEVKLINTES